MNTVGLAAALAAFGAIWFGHVAVRKVEFASPTIWLPAVLFFLLGSTMEWLSTLVHLLPLSVAVGIIGITLLWDSIELFRQQARVRKGHAPANPHNPRHAAILAEPASRATTINLLGREPAL